MEFQQGHYYWLSNGNKSEDCLVYCYVNPDNDTLSLAYFASDGAAVMPVADIANDIEVSLVTLNIH